jgi:gamma-glutamyl:cysteine ligase YbdK (ATP-grasp superfamily)
VNAPPRLRLFEAVGVEVEYMIVDATLLDVRPLADRLFQQVLGSPGSDVVGRVVSWSNELVAHVVELKSTVPTRDLGALRRAIVADAARIDRELAPLHARLMPTAMHPWMDPATQTVLWPGENNEIYAAFDRIFDCRGHGWSNLQSIHLNLPFADDAEFARLHAAVRLVVPAIPALAAGSPFEEGRRTGWLDNRMKRYLTNTRRVPQVAGVVVPEPVWSEDEYRRRILAPIRDALAPLDPDRVLHEEWVNARGAIARFSRGSIEVRVVDSQECPAADMAVAASVVAAVQALAEERWAPLPLQMRVRQDVLVDLLHRSIENPDAAWIDDPHFLACWGLSDRTNARGLWRTVLPQLVRSSPWFPDDLRDFAESLARASLAEAMAASVGPACPRADLLRLARRLCDCLARDEPLPRTYA